jgi:hypothetical protein
LNEEHIRIQALFSETASEHVSKLVDPLTIVIYFVNIFCHSALDDYVISMKAALKGVLTLRDLPATVPTLLEYFSSHFDSIKPIFMQCGSRKILKLFVSFLRSVISLGITEQSFELLHRIFELFPVAVNTNWRHLTLMYEMVFVVVQERPEFVKLAVERNWSSTVSTYISLVYDTSRSQKFLQDIDLSPIFSLSCLLLAEIKDASFKVVIDHSSKIMHGKAHGPAFLKLLAHLCRGEMIDWEQLIALVLPVKADLSPSLFESVLSLIVELDNEKMVESLIRACCNRQTGKNDTNVFLRSLYDAVNGRKDDVILAVRKFSRQLVIPFLFDVTRDSRSWAFYIIQRLFCDNLTHKLVRTPTPAEKEFIHEFSVNVMTYLSGFIPSIPAFLRAQTTSPTCTSDASLYYFIKVGRWMFSSQQLFEESSFKTLFVLLDVLIANSQNHYNIALTIQWLLDFHELVSPHFRRLHEILLNSETQPNIVWIFFRFLRRYFQFASVDELHIVLAHPSYQQIQCFLIPSSSSKCYDSLTSALVAHLDDDVCRSEILRLFERIIKKFSWSIAASAISPPNLAKIAKYLPESVVDILITGINETLASKPRRRDDYNFSLTNCIVFIEEPTIGIEKFIFSCAQILAYVASSNDIGFVNPALDFVVAVCRKTSETELVNDCNKILAKTKTDIGIKVYVPVIIRLVLLVENASERLWELFTEWIGFQHWVQISLVLFGELAKQMCPSVKPVVMQMCAAEEWKFEINHRGKACFERAVEIMTDEEALTTIGAIVGELDEITTSADWSLVYVVFRKFPGQAGAIKDILRDKVPVRGRHVMGSMENVFADDSEEESDG